MITADMAIRRERATLIERVPSYLTDTLKQLMAGAPGVYSLWLNFAGMGGWLVVLLVLGVSLWRWG
jgi:hypothetical protein